MSEFSPLAGKVCLVTGATRGIGKGIALQLGQNGATVYITGRTLSGPGGSLENTAKEVEERGGKCIPVQCDHSKDEDIKSLFDRIQREQDGQLDVLVNNAYSAVKAISDSVQNHKKFWELEPTMWDEVNNVGLRNHYYCSVYAARMMVPRRQGLIINISSGGGLKYLFNIAYGVGKQALDRMAVDCAFELRQHNVACISLWPGAVLTETIEEDLQKSKGKEDKQTQQFLKVFSKGESTEYAGKAVVYLAKEPKIMKRTGRILFAEDLGDEYGFVDTNGLKPRNFRRIKDLLELREYNWLASYTPGFLKIPLWMITLTGSKF